MFGELTVSSRSPCVCRWKAREFGGAAVKLTGRGLLGLPTSTTVNPSENMWPTKAWPLWTMTCTPSPRPARSLWPTKSMLRADSGVMGHSCEVAYYCTACRAHRQSRANPGALFHLGRNDNHGPRSGFADRHGGGAAHV